MPNLPSLEPSSATLAETARGGSRATRREQVYLDYHASTPCDPRVVEAMLPFFIETFANPSSSIHAQGREAAEAVEKARAQVGQAIGSASGELIFTSGATESNNLAIQGAVRCAPAGRRKILATAIEHKCVLESCRWLGRHGYTFELIPVAEDGLVDLAALVDLVDERTALVSVQAASNEIGTIQPIAEIGQVVHRAGALLHSDAAQALGRIPIDVGQWGVDLLSLSGHKCYGPKGIGALYVRGGSRSAPLEPLLFGGGQEAGLRPGTLNVPGVVGFGKACEIARVEMPAESRRIGQLRDWFEKLVLERVQDVNRNGALSRRLAGNSSLRFDGVDAEALIANLPEFALSTGSACTSGALEPSHVLTAIGLSRDAAYNTVRIGIGRFTMEQELEYAAARIAQVVERIRSLR